MYVYGILNSNTSLHLSIPKDLLSDPSSRGIGRSILSGLEESESNGIVYTIPYQDISALVRDSEIVDGSTSLTINPERAKRVERVDYTHMRTDILARLLIGHQTVIERVMTAQTAIIPMRLGTHALDETEVVDVLNKGYNLIKQIFEKISDKIEIDVVVTWGDFNSVLKEIGEEREIKEVKERFSANPAEITMDDRMKVGVMVKNALDKKREKYAQEIQEALKMISRDCRAHELMDGRMIINAAYLIDKAMHKNFEGIIERLNVEFSEKLNFRCVGPLPLYSFYTLEIKKLKFEEIDGARRKLGLQSNLATKNEIKKAYQSMAFSSHPDKNPDTPGIEREFDEVMTAYKLLCEYCQQDSCSFDEDEFKKNSILVRVRA